MGLKSHNMWHGNAGGKNYSYFTDTVKMLLKGDLTHELLRK